MKIPQRGLDRETILETLRSYKEGDLPWQSGRVMAYVYDPGNESMGLAKDAYMMYLSENALDPTTYPSLLRLEKEVCRMVRHLLRGDENVVGNVTSGGTESNLLAVKTARDLARATRPGIERPEMVLPLTAHPSFWKACSYFDIVPVPVAFHPVTFQTDVGAMRAAITDNTILLVASAPGYAQGVVDPIEEIGALAESHDIGLHVDACVGGIHLSFMRRMGYEIPAFDFTVPCVSSISTDMHKYGYAPKNASVILYRSKDLRRHQIFACMRTTTYVLVNPTLLSSKSGAPLAGSWAMLQLLGEEGYEGIVREVQEATTRLVEGIDAVEDLRVLGRPDMCMFSFTSDKVNLFEVQEEMRSRGWYLQPQFSTELSPYNLHISVNHSSVPHVEVLLQDLAESVQTVKGKEDAIDLDAVRGQVEILLQSAPDGDPDQLFALAGLSGSELPEFMVLINSLMECLPRELVEQMLVGFMNELYA